MTSGLNKAREINRLITVIIKLTSIGPPVLRRAVFLVPGIIALLAGLDAALILLGVGAPIVTERLPDVHGMLMVFGFVGTLICLERAVALRKSLGFAAPALLGASGLLLMSPAPLSVGKTVQLAGMLGFVALYIPLWRRQRDDAVLIQAFGAVFGACACIMWLGGTPIELLIPWLAGFVIFTICGERLELARLVMGPRAGRDLLSLSAFFVLGVCASLLWPEVGYPLLGLTLLAMVAWLIIHDVARHTLTSTGLPRYIAGCLLTGYFWLVVAAVIWIVGGPATTGVRYDAVIHAVFLGFTISMIMAHAPVILPAVLRVPLPYHPALIIPVGLLHISLLIRLWLGDAHGSHTAWQLGGVLNVTALLLFIVTAIWSAVFAKPIASARTPTISPPAPPSSSGLGISTPETRL